MECYECGRKVDPSEHGMPPVLINFQDGADKSISGSIDREFCGAACASEHLQNVVEDNAVHERKASRR